MKNIIGKGKGQVILFEDDYDESLGLFNIWRNISDAKAKVIYKKLKGFHIKWNYITAKSKKSWDYLINADKYPTQEIHIKQVSNPNKGDLYYDKHKDKMYQWDELWFEVVKKPPVEKSDFPPNDPKLGDLIFLQDEKLIKKWDSEAWININDLQKKWRLSREKIQGIVSNSTEYIARDVYIGDLKEINQQKFKDEYSNKPIQCIVSIDPAIKGKDIQQAMSLWKKTGNLVYEHIPLPKKGEAVPYWNVEPELAKSVFADSNAEHMKALVPIQSDMINAMQESIYKEMNRISGIPSHLLKEDLSEKHRNTLIEARAIMQGENKFFIKTFDDAY